MLWHSGYLGFETTFDKVPHHKLLKKKLNWQSKRLKKVVINGAASESAPVTSRVSVLGHMLFKIYISENDVGLSDLISKFADDTTNSNPVLSVQDRQNVQDYFSLFD